MWFELKLPKNILVDTRRRWGWSRNRKFPFNERELLLLQPRGWEIISYSKTRPSLFLPPPIPPSPAAPPTQFLRQFFFCGTLREGGANPPLGGGSPGVVGGGGKQANGSISDWHELKLFFLKGKFKILNFRIFLGKFGKYANEGRIWRGPKNVVNRVKISEWIN